MSIITRDMPITGTAKYKTIIHFNPFIKKGGTGDKYNQRRTMVSATQTIFI